MTVMDALRSVRPGSTDPGPEGEGAPGRVPPWLSAVLNGVATALLSSVVVIGPTLLAWSADGRSRASTGTTLGLGASLWLMVQGAHLRVDPTTVAFVPLGLCVVLVAVTAYGAFRVVRHRPEDDERGTAPLPRTATLALAHWWVGYAAVTGVGLLLTRSGPAAPVGASLVYPFVVVPVVGAAAGVAAQRRHEEDLIDPTLARRVLPDALRRAFAPALRGVGTLVGVGSLVVIALVGWHIEDVRHVQAALDTGAAGGAVLAVAQLAALPNLALWAVSFLAGPGFQIVDGATTTLTGSQSGLMPIVPVFAALPGPGDFPLVMLALVLVPVLAGGVVGRRALGAVARLASLRSKAAVATTAALLAAGLTGLLDAFAGGRLGTYKLSEVGAPALPLAAALAVELVVGALAVVAWDAWRLRR
jgi:hypothetical protein